MEFVSIGRFLMGAEDSTKWLVVAESGIPSLGMRAKLAAWLAQWLDTPLELR